MQNINTSARALRRARSLMESLKLFLVWIMAIQKQISDPGRRYKKDLRNFTQTL